MSDVSCLLLLLQMMPRGFSTVLGNEYRVFIFLRWETGCGGGQRRWLLPARAIGRRKAVLLLARVRRGSGTEGLVVRLETRESVWS